MPLLIYLALTFVTYLVFGAAIYGTLLKHNILDKLNRQISFLMCIGLSLPLVTLILHYLLFLFPNYSDKVYLSIILIIITGLFLYAYSNLKQEFFSVYKIDNKIKYSILAILAGFFIVHTYYIFHREITEHDYLEYGSLGKIFYRDKSIIYSSTRFDPETNFFYVGLHGFLFPLTYTWERIFNSTFNVGQDVFFKAVSGIYALLTVGVFYSVSKQYFESKKAFWATIIFLLTFGFFIVSLRFHIDTLRLLFFSVSSYLVFKSLERNSYQSPLLLGLFLGLQCYSHSLGAFLTVISCMTLFLFCGSNFVYRIKHISLLILLIVIFGGWHYLMDIFFGTGWIFKSIKFY